MNKLESEYRHPSRKSIDAIIEKFKWPYEEWMQDWPLEVSDKIDIGFCLDQYIYLTDDDEKFLLMTGILYAWDELQGARFEQYRFNIIDLLNADFPLHKSLIYYWTLYGTSSEYGFQITPVMRDVWRSNE